MSVSNIRELKTRINVLEHKSELMEDQLTSRFHQFGESLRPMNLLKEVLPAVLRSPGAKKQLLGAGISLALSILTNRFFLGKSAGVVRKVAGTAIQAGLGSLLAKKIPVWKNFAANILSRKNGL